MCLPLRDFKYRSISWFALSVDLRKNFSPHIARKRFFIATFASGLPLCASEVLKGKAGQPTTTARVTCAGNDAVKVNARDHFLTSSKSRNFSVSSIQQTALTSSANSRSPILALSLYKPYPGRSMPISWNWFLWANSFRSRISSRLLAVPWK